MLPPHELTCPNCGFVAFYGDSALVVGFQCDNCSTFITAARIGEPPPQVDVRIIQPEAVPTAFIARSDLQPEGVPVKIVPVVYTGEGRVP
jgi:hypothetical protein